MNLNYILIFFIKASSQKLVLSLKPTIRDNMVCARIKLFIVSKIAWLLGHFCSLNQEVPNARNYYLYY